MNNQEARLILQAYHPDGRDAADPFFAEALEQARRDPELAKWFAEENALETHVQARLQTAVQPPPELKANLLAMRKVVRLVPWWHQPMNLAAAAAVLLLLGLAAFLLPRQRSAPIASFRQTMVQYAMQQQGHIVFKSHNLAGIRQWLQDRGMETNFDLPSGLQSGLAHGCRVVDWKGRKATMLCFMVNDREHMDLFIMDRVGLPGIPDDGVPQFAQAGGLTTAVWARGGKVYLLASADGSFLHKFLRPI